MTTLEEYKKLTLAIVHAAIKDGKNDNIIFWRRLYTFVKNYSQADLELFEDGVSAKINDSKVVIKYDEC